MKKIKSEKGAITILTLVSLVFLTTFLISSYIIMANKMQSQRDVISDTKKLYESYDLNQIYNGFFGEQDIIPIYTSEEFESIANGENKIVNGKIYNFASDKTYILMNDIKLDRVWFSDELPQASIEFNGHSIIADNIAYPYTWILDSFKQRNILQDSDILQDDTLLKIAKIMQETKLPVNCFSVNKLTEGDEYKEFIVYLYGPIYNITFVADDGEASYEARKEKILQLNSIEYVDGMLVGDMNENGIVEEKDKEIYDFLVAYEYEKLPYYGQKEDSWLEYYFAIIGDCNNDETSDGTDIMSIDIYLENKNISSFEENILVKYDIENNSNEEEIKLFNY